MVHLIIRNQERQRVVEAVERIAAASGRRVLNGEPEHKIREFADEVLGRAHLVIQDMGHEIDRLARRLLDLLDHVRYEHLMITLSGVRFHQTRWLTDGQIEILFTIDVPQPPDPELFHAVIDPFVDDVCEGLDVPADVRAELAGFVKRMAMQFAVIKRHAADVDLRRITFDDFAWAGARTLRFKIKHAGRPLLPRDIGWD